ncbi:hypothetical protein HZC34_07330 [Candidatus Saganbacteria bacterium]|nr:hypothetical protein [Candidatus Saganbacteria bacterium]
MSKLKEKYITNEKGQKEAVILNVRTYEELLEDLEDLYTIADRKKDKTIPLISVKRSLKRSGLL